MRASWELLILKILASRPDGEVTISELTRDLQILNEGCSAIVPPNDASGLFTMRFVDRPRKGTWRITSLGRKYLLTVEMNKKGRG